MARSRQSTSATLQLHIFFYFGNENEMILQMLYTFAKGLRLEYPQVEVEKKKTALANLQFFPPVASMCFGMFPYASNSAARYYGY